MDIHSILQLLVLVNEVKTRGELIAEVEKLVASYGFKHYALSMYARADGARPEVALLENWPKNWKKIYTEKKFDLVDPARRMLAVAHRPFRWRDAIHAFRDGPYRKRFLRLLHEAAKFDLLDGYVFPIFGKTGLLGRFVICGKPVELSPVEISLFDTAARTIFRRLLEIDGLTADHEQRDVADTDLTRRQMEVLTLLADGMTSNEIARELQISSHTVDWYINVIQEKFNAKNRQHVIAIAFRLGFLT